jgi:two-component system cell cycle sensor histidine kinase/response regulator CckA
MAFRFLTFLTGRRKKKQPDFYNHPLPRLIFNRESLRYLAANKAAQALYGYTEEEFKVLTLREIRPVWELQKLERHLNEQALYGNNTGVWKHLKKNGDIMLVRVSAEDVVFEGQPQRLVTIEEITPHKISTFR